MAYTKQVANTLSYPEQRYPVLGCNTFTAFNTVPWISTTRPHEEELAPAPLECDTRFSLRREMGNQLSKRDGSKRVTLKLAIESLNPGGSRDLPFLLLLRGKPVHLTELCLVLPHCPQYFVHTYPSLQSIFVKL